MKLNREQPYGTVTGHESAQFEQNGILFDGGGNPIGGEVIPPKNRVKTPVQPVLEPKPALINDKQLANAADFLKGLLSGGPIDKSVVFKEAESNNQRWETVKRAFTEIAGKELRRGQSTLWSLNYETQK